MDAAKKMYYPWELWTKAAESQEMRFLSVRFSRIHPEHVCHAVVSVPAISSRNIAGKVYKLRYWKEVYLKSNGDAYSKTGSRLKMYDLKLSEHES